MDFRLTSLVDVLRYRADTQPHHLACRFLSDGENEEAELSYYSLDRQCKHLAALIHHSANPGDRTLLLLPAGLDFVAAYFACLYAGTIAIPVPPPHPARLDKTMEPIYRIIQDAAPSTALISETLFAALEEQGISRGLSGQMEFIITDQGNHHSASSAWKPHNILSSDIAFLQYTSGSTTTPKGVMVSHQNLMQNLAFIEKAMGLSGSSNTVFWLPPYHDMGLIGGILQAIFTGYPVTLMPHLLFLQRPYRWLQAISKYRATTSGGPHFAYELCLRKVRPEQRDDLDLSSWEVAFNGAEPIFHQTLDEFAAYFAPCGFRKEAFFPCYGLAESTLMVSGGPRLRLPKTLHLDKSGIEENKVILREDSDSNVLTYVGCGRDTGEQNIQIVNPETKCPCATGEIGEIWLQGPFVAKGYWNNPGETEAAFQAMLMPESKGPFLRTGDLGFSHQGELYITGRIKNLLIIAGKNHYAHDIERTAESSHPAIQPAGCAVFSISEPGFEKVIILAEVQPKQVSSAGEVITKIRKAVNEQHDIPVADVKLILPGGLPKTTSGKTRHFLCRKQYLTGTLKEITSL